MKRKKRYCFVIIILISGFNSCNPWPKHKRNVYSPVYITHDELKSQIQNIDNKELQDLGKIYIKDNYIFINELNKGIHVIDNTNPEVPEKTTFINIPGNKDIAIRNNSLYADSYTDLVAVNIDNINNVVITKQIIDVFPGSYPHLYQFENGTYDYNARYLPVDKSKGIVIGWEFVRTEEYSTSPVYASSDSSGNSTGTGGSLARFTIVADYLYALNGGNMNLFDITDPPNPLTWSRVEIGWDIETIFPYEDNIFIGSRTGMYIFDNTDPSNPTQISEFAHVTSCDPVVVEGSYAYVTLKGGSGCGGVSNQLDIIDISDLKNPSLVKSYGMHGPYGLGVDNNLLFICDGEAGLKVFDAADPLQIALQFHTDEFETYDVILNNDIALVVGPDGLYQFDYSDINNIIELSKIEIDKDEE
jgi:hypothetical protein